MNINLIIITILGIIIGSIIAVNLITFVIVIASQRVAKLITNITQSPKNQRSKHYHYGNTSCDSAKPQNNLQDVETNIRLPFCENIETISSTCQQIENKEIKTAENGICQKPQEQALCDLFPSIFFMKYLFHTRFGKRLLGYEYISNKNGKSTIRESNHHGEKNVYSLKPREPCFSYRPIIPRLH